MSNCFISFLILFFIIMIVFRFYLKNNNYEMYSNFKKNFFIEKTFPFYEYQYLCQYFDLYYQYNKDNIQKKVDSFFHNVSIIFISLKRKKERVRNIHQIIKKYNLKNVYIINAIDYLNLKKNKDRYFIKNENINYYFDNTFHETIKEIACSFSHLKAILFANSLSSPYTMIVEDDICFDYIPFSKYTIEELYSKLPEKESYLSLYTNKPDYDRDILDLQLAHFSEGYYGAVSYVMSKEIIKKIYNISKVSSNSFSLPKIKKTLFVADHYFGSLFKNYHLSSSILVPNNLEIQSSLHKDHHQNHLNLQYKYLLELYKKETFIVDIPKIFILFNNNPFKEWYNKTYSNYLFSYVKTFQEGIFLLKKKGGIFIFNIEHKVNLPLINSLIVTSPYYIISIPNHPYLEWISSTNSLNIELNHFLTLSLEKKDYQFIEEPYKEKFIFIIPSYNNEKWVEKNLSSILSQKKENWFIYYIDDCSTDNTLYKVSKFIHENNISNKINVIKNKKRMYQAYSRYIAYKKTKPNDILILLDGDDWLYNDNVLNILEREYHKGYLCTNGTSVEYLYGLETKKYSEFIYPIDTIRKNNYRSYKWQNSHLRTCRSWLLSSIPEKHLKDKNGKWLEHTTDLAEWFWVLEQSKGNRKWISDILCIYNKENSLNHSNSWSYNSNSIKRHKIINYVRSHK